MDIRRRKKRDVVDEKFIQSLIWRSWKRSFFSDPLNSLYFTRECNDQNNSSDEKKMLCNRR